MRYSYNNFYEILTKVAKENPNQVVLFEEKEKLKYRELKQNVDKVAAYLQLAGVKFGDKVAMAVTNSKEFIISYLASSASFFYHHRLASFSSFYSFAQTVSSAGLLLEYRDHYLWKYVFCGLNL